MTHPLHRATAGRAALPARIRPSSPATGTRPAGLLSRTLLLGLACLLATPACLAAQVRGDTIGRVSSDASGDAALTVTSGIQGTPAGRRAAHRPTAGQATLRTTTPVSTGSDGSASSTAAGSMLAPGRGPVR